MRTLEGRSFVPPHVHFFTQHKRRLTPEFAVHLWRMPQEIFHDRCVHTYRTTYVQRLRMRSCAWVAGDVPAVFQKFWLDGRQEKFCVLMCSPSGRGLQCMSESGFGVLRRCFFVELCAALFVLLSLALSLYVSQTPWPPVSVRMSVGSTGEKSRRCRWPTSNVRWSSVCSNSSRKALCRREIHFGSRASVHKQTLKCSNY